jgi:hypothetical protein
MMKRGVPKKRAKRSAAMPKRSLPKAPWWTMLWGVAGFTMLLSCASRGQRRCAEDVATSDDVGSLNPEVPVSILTMAKYSRR